MQSKKAYIKTYGCQANTYDSDRIISILSKLGYKFTDKPMEADIAFVNTCHIREKSELKMLSDLGRLKIIKDEARKNDKDFFIVICGCVAQAYGDELIKQAPYVSLTLGPQTYHRIPEYLMKLTRNSNVNLIDIDFPEEQKFDYLPQIQISKASAFLSIQEGCNKFCTFCCVPYTRGPEYSRPVQAVLKEALFFGKNGVKEITLLGQNVNAYHGLNQNNKESNLAELIREISNIPEIKRIRYMTSHPRDVDDALIDTHGKIQKLMPFLHLPVQSGSNEILKNMNRKHTIEQYVDIIKKFKKARPDIVISSDFIAGYPGETNEDHQQTLEIIHNWIDIGFSFKYSPRPGTPASMLENQISENIQLKRLYEIQEILRFKQLCLNQRTIGQNFEILVEKEGKYPNQLIGKSPYLQSVIIEGEKKLINSFVNVYITKGFQNSLQGEIIDSKKIRANA